MIFNVVPLSFSVLDWCSFFSCTYSLFHTPYFVYTHNFIPTISGRCCSSSHAYPPSPSSSLLFSLSLSLSFQHSLSHVFEYFNFRPMLFLFSCIPTSPLLLLLSSLATSHRVNVRVPGIKYHINADTNTKIHKYTSTNTQIHSPLLTRSMSGYQVSHL